MSGPIEWPAHVAVDWTTVRKGRKPGRNEVLVTCQRCGKGRYLSAGDTAYKIKWNSFSGDCKSCRPRYEEARELPSRGDYVDDAGEPVGGFNGALTGMGLHYLREYERDEGMRFWE